MDIAVFRLRSMLVPEYRKSHANLYNQYSNRPFRIVYELTSNTIPTRNGSYHLMVQTFRPDLGVEPEIMKQNIKRWYGHGMNTRFEFPRNENEDPIWSALTFLHNDIPYSRIIMYPNLGVFPGYESWERTMRSKRGLDTIISGLPY